MQTKSDGQLLREYAQGGSEPAFTEIVARHMDLVYSAALRQVPSPDLARDVAQCVFTSLARGAQSLSGRFGRDASLAGWLYRCTRNVALNLRRDDHRRQSRERQAMEQLHPIPETAPDWDRLRPLLDEAMSELNEADHDALVLRYFNNHDLRTVGLALGITDDAAQKRVSRAVERLRECFSRRGVTVGASGFVAVISANAVQAAPVGLAVTISAAAALAGATVSSATAIVATKAITMTPLQKTLVTATVAVLAGAGIYEARQASQLREQNQTLQQQQAPLTEHIQRLQRERDDATNRLAALQAEEARLKSDPNQNELLRLRGEVGLLRRQLVDRATNSNPQWNGLATMMSDPALKEYMQQNTLRYVASGHSDLIRELHLTAEQRDKFIKIVGEAGFKITEAFATQNQEGFEQAKSAIKEDMESELKSLLGEPGLARFNEFNQEVPARATLDLLNDEIKGKPITEAQRASLLQIIKAEPYNLTHGIVGEVDRAFLGSPEDVADYLQKVAESNRHILQQAGDILSPDQLAALNTVLTNGINTRKVYGQALVQKR
jgi:RNA polymerase sigma factor (sigma-70 family)